MLSLLRDYASSKGLVFRPLHFQLDYERAAMKAIEDTFPVAEVKGYNFHFCQAITRKMQNLGLEPFYKEPPVRR